MKYSKTMFLLTVILFLIYSCSEEDMFPEDAVETSSLEYHCNILGQIHKTLFSNTTTGETQLVFDTTKYFYDQRNNLVKREFDRYDYDSLVYEIGILSKIYKIKDNSEIILESKFEYSNSNLLIRSIHQGVDWYGHEIDSFFYNTEGMVERISTHREAVFIHPCDDLTLKQEIIFVYDEDKQLVRDTIKEYQYCDEEIRAQEVNVTAYSDHTVVKNPFYKSPFREDYRISVIKYLIRTEKYATFINNMLIWEGHSWVDLGLIAPNEYRYPMYGYIYECEEI